MNELTIDEARFTSAQDVHACVAKELNFPDYYGANLDALNDCLGDIADECDLNVFLAAQVPFLPDGTYDASMPAAEYAEWFPKFVRALLRAARENEDLVINVFAPSYEAIRRLLACPGIPELLEGNTLRSECLISTP